jgi:hypothetical protein
MSKQSVPMDAGSGFYLRLLLTSSYPASCHASRPPDSHRYHLTRAEHAYGFYDKLKPCFLM